MVDGHIRILPTLDPSWFKKREKVVNLHVIYVNRPFKWRQSETVIQNNCSFGLIVFKFCTCCQLVSKKDRKYFLCSRWLTRLISGGRPQLIFINFVKPYLLASPLQWTMCWCCYFAPIYVWVLLPHKAKNTQPPPKNKQKKILMMDEQAWTLPSGQVTSN